MTNGIISYIKESTSTDKFSEDKRGYLQKNRLGLHLLLLSISSTVTERIMKLRETMDVVERRLFSPDIVKTLNDRELIGFYKLLSDTNSEYISFIERILKDTNFLELEGMLLETEASKKAKKEMSQAQVRDLIEHIAQKLTDAQDKKAE